MLYSQLENTMKNFEGLAGIVIKDLSTGEVKDINAGEVFRAASTIKLCILWELYKEASKGNLSLDEKMELKDREKVGGCGILKELNGGLKLSLKEIATLMIIQSDNTATNMLIDRLGIENINNSMKALGLNETSLQRKMFDIKGMEAGLDNYTTPNDMAILLEEFLNTTEIKEELKKDMLDIMLKQQLKGKLPAMFDGDVVFAHKTGELSDVEHDVGILFLEDKTLIVVALLKDINNCYEARILHNRMGKLIYDYYNEN